MTDQKNPGFSTNQLHVGTTAAAATPRALPIYLTAGFTFDNFEQGVSHFGEGTGYAYTRTGNPTIDAVEDKITAIEGGTRSLLVGSGQAAVSTAIFALAGAGDHIVSSTHIYEGSRGLFLDLLPRLGITVTFVDDIANPEAWRAAITDNTKILFGESISNATNLLIDVAAVAAVGRECGIPLIIDNTFATPYLFRPLEHGAALSVHSTSKFLSGQGSVIGGVIVDGGTFDADIHRARFPHLVTKSRLGGASYAEKYGADTFTGYAKESIAPRIGPTLSPLSAFLLGQGIETLSLRVRELSRQALEVAKYLEKHPAVESVDYVGLPNHPHHELAQQLLPRGYGSVFSFTLRGGREAAAHVVNSVQTFTHMTHLGDVRSLLLHPETTSHAFRTPEERAEVGVYPGTLRVSVGLEDLDDLFADLDRVL